MKSTAITFLSFLWLMLGPLHVAQAFEVGGRCYANKATVSLLTDPDRASTPQAQAVFAAEFRILETRGRWLKVKGAAGEGWAFAGNLSPQKPSEENKTDFLPTAGETGAAVAARPLAETTRDFASRQSHGDALTDLEWLESFAGQLGTDALTTYQQTSKRGEFAP